MAAGDEVENNDEQGYARRRSRVMPLLLLALALVYGSPTTLHAQTVTSTADSGPGSLRQAIADASPGAVIDFDPSLSGQTITLTSGQLGISKNLTITGLGASQLAVSGNFASRVFNVTGGTVTISGLTIRDGRSGSQNPGGGVASSSSLTLANCVVTNNATGNGGFSSDGGYGGGIYSNGSSLTLDQSTVSSNATGAGGTFAGDGGWGGGIYVASGTLTITGSTISGNTTGVGTAGDDGGWGGGIAFVGSTLTITGSTISGNTTGNGSPLGGHGGHGGGLHVGTSTLTLTNSTISGNLTGNGGSNRNGGDGGGIYAWGTSAAINNTTLSNNTTGIGSGSGVDGRGGGLFNNAGAVTLYSTLVAENNAATGPDLSGSFSSNGYNLIGNGDGSSGLTDGINNDQVGTTASPVDPMLDALGNYGGTTQTHRLQHGSPAIDKGDCSATSPPSDQRGEARIHDEPGVPDAGDGCDVGAVEGTVSELPVELVSFEALADGRAIHLHWETASETNNAGFFVEMSSGAIRAFEPLGFVAGHGTTLEAQSYAYRVANLEPGRYVFRLKQIDYDGTFAFSPDVEVVLALPEAFRLTPAYPNPFNPRARFSLMVKRRQHITVAVYNVQGQRVRTLFDGEMQAEQARALVFEAEGLPGGVYFIRATGEGFTASQPAVLLR